MDKNWVRVVSLVITGELAEAVITAAQRCGCTPEEYIAMKVLTDLDPEQRVRIYASLFRKYHSEARKLAEENDVVQACEKYWGAVTSLLNIVGELKNMRHYRHSDYWEIMGVIVSETGDDELNRLFAVVEKMHANYYHNFIKPENFPRYVRDAELLIRKIKSYIAAIDKHTAELLEQQKQE